MTTYHYSNIAVYAELAGALRLASGARAFVTDPTTGLPVNVTQGSTVAPYLDIDTAGRAAFTAESWPVRVTAGTVFEDMYPVEAPQAMRDAVTAAEAAVAAATAPTDAAVAALIPAASLTQTAGDTRWVQTAATQAINRGGTGATTAPTALVALGGAPLSLVGTYAARPVANTVAAGTIYYCSDIPEQYRSNGTAWSVVGAGGNELGYTQITASTAAQGPAVADVPGVTTTFVVGERPIEVSVGGMFLINTALIYAIISIDLDGTVIGTAREMSGSTTQYVSLARAMRASGLTPGSTHTAKLRVETTSGTVTPTVGATNPMFVSVKTL